MESGGYLNCYEVANLEAQRTGRSRDEILREILKDWYPRRTAFDRFFEDGETFKYGALNIGGVGCANYGAFCLILAPTSSLSRTGYLSGDSLKRYLRDEIEVDAEKLKRECAPASHRQFLATEKYLQEIKREDKEKWASCVCNNEEYIEAIISAEITVAHFQAVRIAESDYLRFSDMMLDAAYGRLTEESDRQDAAAFQYIEALLERKGIPLEQVER